MTIGIIYQPPNQSNFLLTLNENFTKLDTIKKEIYILGDFNTNLHQNQNQFCKIFGLRQTIKLPTRTTCSSTPLIDHILASLHERISQEGVKMLVYQTTNSFITLGKIVELKRGMCTKKLNSVPLRLM